MSFDVAERFARKHGGMEGLARFTEMIRFGCPDCRHGRRRCRLSHVARVFGLSVSEVCQLRAKLFVPDYKPTPGHREYVESQKAFRRWQEQEQSAVILKLYGDGDVAA